MSNPYRDKLLGVGFMRGGRTRPRVREGRKHPDSGAAFKATTDELGNTTTEHATPTDRVDVQITAPSIHVRASQTEIRH